MQVERGIGKVQPQSALNDRLKALSRSISLLERKSDRSALKEVQAEAEEIGRDTDGRMRRRAERIAKKARIAADELAKNGIETLEEKATRQAREQREEGSRLSGRLVSLLYLVFNDGKPPASEVAVLGPLVTSHDAPNQDELRESLSEWSTILTRGYTHSYAMFETVGGGSVQETATGFERILKSVIVDLLTTGANVTSVRGDPIPLVAYALFDGRLPTMGDPALSGSEDKLNDILLSVLDDVSEVRPASRPRFLALFRLAVLLGVAQRYSETYLARTSFAVRQG